MSKETRIALIEYVLRAALNSLNEMLGNHSHLLTDEQRDKFKIALDHLQELQRMLAGHRF
jgi:hypothetical protein